MKESILCTILGHKKYGLLPQGGDPTPNVLAAPTQAILLLQTLS